MKSITVKEIINSCGGELFADSSVLQAEVTSIVTNSAQATEGSMFVAIKGERVDAHKFIPDVKAQGAVCALVEEVADCDLPQIKVDSTLIAVKQIAEYCRSLYSIPFIGVTGSVGKTSTK